MNDCEMCVDSDPEDDQQEKDDCPNDMIYEEPR